MNKNKKRPAPVRCDVRPRLGLGASAASRSAEASAPPPASPPPPAGCRRERAPCPAAPARTRRKKEGEKGGPAMGVHGASVVHCHLSRVHARSAVARRTPRRRKRGSLQVEAGVLVVVADVATLAEVQAPDGDDLRARERWRRDAMRCHAKRTAGKRDVSARGGSSRGRRRGSWIAAGAFPKRERDEASRRGAA